MANYSNLKTAIENAVDWNNGDNEITGQNLLDILETIIDSLGAKYKFADVATPSSSITTPDEPLFYLAGEGTYTNFSGLSVTIPRGTLAIFYYDTAWHYTTVRTDSDAFFNVNQHQGTPSTTYTKANARNAVPEALRSKGMIITYLTTNGWIIEQNLSTSGTWNADANWQTIGPVSVSQNTSTGKTKLSISSEIKNIAGYNSLFQSIVNKLNINNFILNAAISSQYGTIGIGGGANGWIVVEPLPIISGNKITISENANNYVFHSLYFYNKEGEYLGEIVAPNPNSINIDEIINTYSNATEFAIVLWNGSASSAITPTDVEDVIVTCIGYAIQTTKDEKRGRVKFYDNKKEIADVASYDSLFQAITNILNINDLVLNGAYSNSTGTIGIGGGANGWIAVQKTFLRKNTRFEITDNNAGYLFHSYYLFDKDNNYIAHADVNLVDSLVADTILDSYPSADKIGLQLWNGSASSAITPTDVEDVVVSCVGMQTQILFNSKEESGDTLMTILNNATAVNVKGISEKTSFDILDGKVINIPILKNTTIYSNGNYGTYNGFISTPKIPIADNIEILSSVNTKGYQIIEVRAWNGSTNLGRDSVGATNGYSYIPKERILKTYPTATHIGLVLWDNSTLTALTDADVVDINITIKNTRIYKSPLRLFPKTMLPTISFCVDDNRYQDNAIADFFESYGLRLGFAFIASQSNMIDQIGRYIDFQKRGHSILNHCIDGNKINTTNYATIDLAQAAIMTAKNRLEKAGIFCNGFVAPGSDFEPTYMSALEKLQAYAYTTRESITATGNGRNQNRCDLHRWDIVGNTLADTKTYIDNAIANDQMATFYFHGFEIGETWAGEVFDWTKLGSIIEYCINKRDLGLVYIGNPDECAKYFFDL